MWRLRGRRTWVPLALGAALATGPAPAAAQAPTAPAQAPAPGPAPVTPTPQELAALLLRPQAKLIPRSTEAVERIGVTPARPAAQPVGARVVAGAPAVPGGTTNKAGAKPLRRSFRISCRRTTTRRWRCSAVDKRTRYVVRRCTAERLAVAQRACADHLRRQAPGTVTVGGSTPRATLRAGVITWNGWPSRAMSAVGKLYMPKVGGRVGYCSGTVVARNLVLTAGHCLTDKGVSNPTVHFVPGQSWSAPADANSITAPYGIWTTTSQRWWVPEGWLRGADPALDWGLVEFGAGADGRSLSDVVGAWNITPAIRYQRNAHIYVVGYPHSGFWDTFAGFNGRGQYACDTNWDAQGGYIGSGYELFTPCYMNGGASGGPWFVQLSDDRWTIGGVSNRCLAGNMDPVSYCTPYSDYLRSSYLDQGFLDFWNGVQPLLGR